MKYFSRTAGALLMASLLLLQTSPAFAQLGDVTPPPTPPAPPSPVVDLCSNISGDQTSIPSGMILDSSGNCVTPDTIAPQISGVANLSILPTEATIVWTTDELAISHLHYGFTTAYGMDATIGVSAALAHTALLTGLTPSTTYYYCIEATDLAGNTGTSCGQNFTTAAASAPADTLAPTFSLISAAPVATSSATITWTTNESSDSQVEYGTTDLYGSASSGEVNLGLTHSVTLSNLLPNTTYHYRVTSRDAGGNLALSTDNTFTTSAISAGTSVEVTLPPTPGDVTAPVITDVSTLSLEPTDATVIWTTDEFATSQLEYGTTQNYGTSATLSASALLAHTATLLNLSAGTTYYYCIHAADASNNTSSFCGHSFTTAAAPIMLDTNPPTVSLVAIASLTTTSATLNWTTDEVANGYVAYGLTANYGDEASLDTDLSITHTHTINSLAPDTTYHYQIVSSDEQGNVIRTPDNTFTTSALPNTPEIVISNPEASTTVGSETGAGGNTNVGVPGLVFSSIEVSALGQTSATISWNTDAPSDAMIQYGNSTALGFETPLNATLGTSHSVVITNLSPDTTYYFKLVSKPAGIGAVETISQLYNFNTLVEPIVTDPPANLTYVHAASYTPMTASIVWTTDSPTNGAIEYGFTTSYGETTAAYGSFETNHTTALTGLLPGTTYHFRVKAVDTGNNITYSEDHTFTTTGTPSVSVGESSGGTNNSSSANVELTPSSTASSSIPSVDLVIAAPADSEIIFEINNPETGTTSGTEIVRSESGYPTSPNDGTIVYEGDSTTFTDTGLTNGTTYYYSLFSYTSNRRAGNALHVSLSPEKGVSQFKLDKNLVLIQATPTEHFADTLKIGDQNLEVEHLQQVLNTANVHPSGLTTGYFGPLTENALKTFQAQYGLPQTGIADGKTRAILNSISAGWMIAGAPMDIAVLENDLQRGDASGEVGALQEFLTYEGSYGEGIISNYFGVLTEESVKDFQTTYGVTPVSGIVGPKTRHTIQTVLGL